MASAYRALACLSCAAALPTCSHRPRLLSGDQPVSGPSLGHPQSSTSLAISKTRRGRSRGRVSCMYSGHASVVTAASWKVSVLSSDLPVLVQFFASWCGPCKMVDRVIDEIAEEYVGRVRCFKLNADYNPQLVLDHAIERVPTVLLFKDGERLESITGTMPKYVYIKAIEKYMAN